MMASNKQNAIRKSSPEEDLPERSVWKLLVQTGSDWNKDKIPRLGAALAYYTVFSLPGVLFISLAIAGAVFGAEVAKDYIKAQLHSLLGGEAARAIEDILFAAKNSQRGVIASVIGIVVLLFGGSGVFGELQDGLNTVWDAPRDIRRGYWGMLQDRFLSFAMVFGIGFLLLVSLVLSAMLSALGAFAANIIPGPDAPLQIGNQVLSFVVVTILFAMIFKVLPNVEIHWRDVWIGAGATALLFTIGKFLLGLYLGRAGVGSAYGAAGSLVAVLVWVYYSAQILYLGAEFTQAYAQMYGSRIKQCPDTIAHSNVTRNGD